MARDGREQNDWRRNDPNKSKRRRGEHDRGSDQADRNGRDNANKRRRRSLSSEDNDRDRDRRRSDRDDRDYRQRHRNRSRSRSRSREHRRRRHTPSRSLSPPRRVRNTGPLPDQNASFAIERGDAPPAEKQKPNYAPTGLLAREANTVQVSSTNPAGSKASHIPRNIVLKYHEPAEARLPPATQPWRLYRFGPDKDSAPLETLPLSERSCWLFGREKGVADVPLSHDTCGKQHAVIQFRHRASRDEYGDRRESVKPYVIDLESKAGTRLDGKKVEPGRYVELRDGDVLRFGKDEGEWVVMLPPAEE